MSFIYTCQRPPNSYHRVGKCFLHSRTYYDGVHHYQSIFLAMRKGVKLVYNIETRIKIEESGDFSDRHNDGHEFFLSIS